MLTRGNFCSWTGLLMLATLHRGQSQPSPLCLASWTEFIAAHSDQEYVSYVQTGLLSGFRIGFDRDSVPLQLSTRNHPSACENEGQVWGYIAAEREAGYLVGPLWQSDLTGIHTSPIDLVPKSEPNQWRMIVDLSIWAQCQ